LPLVGSRGILTVPVAACGGLSVCPPIESVNPANEGA
jgi:hypothetical protein